MEQTIHTPETYDFRKYDQIWRRVAPNLEPYPDLREPAAPGGHRLSPGGRCGIWQTRRAQLPGG